MRRQGTLRLSLAELDLPIRARVLAQHATEAAPLLDLLERTAGGKVVAVAPGQGEYTALQQSIGAKAGSELTVALEGQAELPPATFDAALLDSDHPSGRGNAYVRQLLDAMARAVKPGGTLWLEGSPRRGVHTFARHLATLGDALTQVSVGGGRRVFRVVRTDRPVEEAADPPAEIEVALRGVQFRLRRRPGVFGSRKLDDATEMLIGALHVGRRDTVLDLGCGVGAIGIAAARLAPEGRVVLADSNPLATRLAEENLQLNQIENATVVLSDGYSGVGDRRFDVIATNPPFHQRSTENREVAERFIREAPEHLRPRGRLYVVANAFLPYERILAEVFPDVETLVATPRYKVLVGERSKTRGDAGAT